MSKAMRQDSMEILDAMKVGKAEPPRAELSVFGKNIHECGTARMGNNPKTSVVDKFGRVHDARNVFVADGAVFVTQGCYEPTLTIMALAARTADYIVEELKHGNL
jgi:choline dehydrogenase-like flavoprotein